MHRIYAAAIGLLASVASGSASASPAIYSAAGVSGVQTLSALAQFSVVGGELQIVLSNNGSDVRNANGVLTALFFDIDGNPALSRVAANQSPGSTVMFGGTDVDGGVGGEWSYRAGLAAAPGGASHGLSSAALGGLFNATNRFPGTDLQGGNNVNGLQYGITSALDDGSTGNAAVTGDNALTQNSVTFLLGALPVGFDVANDITNVYFQYGTALTAPSLVGQVPEPASAAALVVGVAGLLLRRRATATGK